jgi:hypothetical protein
MKAAVRADALVCGTLRAGSVERHLLEGSAYLTLQYLLPSTSTYRPSPARPVARSCTTRPSWMNVTSSNGREASDPANTATSSGAIVYDVSIRPTGQRTSTYV